MVPQQINMLSEDVSCCWVHGEVCVYPMFRDVSGVWGGRQLPSEEKSKNSSSCMFGRFVPLNSFLCFILI